MWFFKLLDKLYVVKRVLSWLFHTVNLVMLMKTRHFRNRYSNVYGSGMVTYEIRGWNTNWNPSY